MSESILLFRDIAMVFAGALLGGLIFERLRQPLILGYVLAGLVLSPLTPGIRVHDVHTFQVMAETGVILLMFSTGIEFSVSELLRLKWIALIGAPLGISLMIGLSIGVGLALGWPVSEGFSVGSIICVASTMVLLRLLMDRGALKTDAGRIMITLTLMEDVVVVVLMIVLAGLGPAGESAHGGVVWRIGKSLLLLVPIVIVGSKVVPWLLSRMEKLRHDEISLLFALTVCLVTAAITEAIGLSLALGAFLGGMMLGDSHYAHALAEKTLPIRDAFVALFFVSIGMLIDPRSLITHLPLLLFITGLVLVGKFLVWTTVVRLFRYPLRTAAKVGIGLTQIGEFSFVLAEVAVHAKLITPDVYNAILTASLATILVNATLSKAIPRPRAGLEANHAAVMDL